MAIVSYNPITIFQVDYQVFKANSPLKFIMQIVFSSTAVENRFSLSIKKAGVKIGEFVLIRFTDPVSFVGNYGCFYVCDCIGAIASDLEKQSFTKNEFDVKSSSTTYEFVVNEVYSISAAFCMASSQYGENSYFYVSENSNRSFYCYNGQPVRLWSIHPVGKDITLSYNNNTKTVNYGGEGVPVIRYIDTVYSSPGVYDFVMSHTTNGTISEFTSKVYVLDSSCKGEVIKYVDRNGMVQSWCFEDIKIDSCAITGRYSSEALKIDNLNSNINGLAVDKTRSIKLRTGLIERKYWPVIDDIVSSPVVQYKYGSQWIAVEVQTKQSDISKSKFQFYDFEIEVKLPRQYTVKYW